MQEFELNRINPRVKFDSLLEAWKYSAFFFTSGSPDQNGRGLAIYSKYPVVRRGGIHYPESNNASMWADVIMHRDTLRVYNNHMQSTQVNESDREYLSGTGLSADSLGDERLKDILRKLGRNFRVRAAQADSIAGIIHDGTPRVLYLPAVAGRPERRFLRKGTRDHFYVPRAARGFPDRLPVPFERLGDRRIRFRAAAVERS